MAGNTLIDEFDRSLDLLVKKKLQEQGAKICHKELAYLRSVIHQASRADSFTRQGFFAGNGQALTEVKEAVIDTINHLVEEGQHLEKELHGVDNFSAYELKRINNYSYKSMLCEALAQMINKMETEQEASISARQKMK